MVFMVGQYSTPGLGRGGAAGIAAAMARDLLDIAGQLLET